MQPTISVILLTYRRSLLLKAAIESVLAQKYQDYVLQVYDDASGDETQSVVEAYAARDPRVRYHRRPANVGAMVNMKLALGDVQTPLFCIFADDDELCPGFLAGAAAAMDQHPDAWFCAGQTVVLDRVSHARSLVSGEIRPGYYSPAAGFEVLTGHHIGLSTCLFRNRVLNEVDFYHAEVFPFNESYTLMKIARRFPFVFLAEPHFVFDSNPNAPHRNQPQQALEAVLVIAADNFSSGVLTSGMKRGLYRWCRSNISKFSRRALDGSGSRFAEHQKLWAVFERRIGGNQKIPLRDRLRLKWMFCLATVLRLFPRWIRRGSIPLRRGGGITKAPSPAPPGQ